MIIRQIRGPILLGNQVGNAREEEIEVICAVDGLQGIVGCCQCWDGGEGLVDGPAKLLAAVQIEASGVPEPVSNVIMATCRPISAACCDT